LILSAQSKIKLCGSKKTFKTRMYQLSILAAKA
jgi:hypothetical protein